MSLAAGKKKNTRSKSLSPSSINPYNQRSCKYRHPNKKIDSSSSTIQCNDCKSKIKKYGTVYGCSRCKFYLCSACFRKPSCANGHLLKATHVKRGTLCSSCQYKSKKARLQFYHCNQCKYHMCLGCYSYETCCGNHGLKWQKITNTTHKSMNHCKKCQRIFKINKSLFMCTKCKYSLCGECYQPSLTLKSKIHRQHKIAQKIKSNQNSKTDILLNNPNGNNNNNELLMSLSPPNEPIIHQLNPDHLGQELKNDDNDDDGNRLYFDNDEEKKTDFSDEENDEEDDYEEEEKKIVLTDDHLAHHNNNYNYPGPAAQYGSHQYTQSYHSYSGSNSHQTHHSRSTSNRSQANNNAPRSKSRDRPTGKKKKKSSVKDRKNRDSNNSNNKGSKRKRKKKSSKTKKKNIRDGTLINNGNTPSLSLSATSSVNMQYMNDQELSSSSTNAAAFYDPFQSGIDMSTCAPSEMTRIPSILTDCCICMERDKEVAFLPCGHYIACEQCAKLLQADTGMCAICSKKIHSIVKIFE